MAFKYNFENEKNEGKKCFCLTSNRKSKRIY